MFLEEERKISFLTEERKKISIEVSSEMIEIFEDNHVSLRLHSEDKEKFYEACAKLLERKV